ncbi:TlpA disulfide reductase family protein [Tamlana sp. 2201CG12-4]|uniref:TlpA family protein disulfide reductase n=1 Tax=Tamlana sp. 2201CG12-4 TaxID=3112582 RepID=UPI002DBCAFF5|nr:TlpA disulfide reductase family protein [Tamlana sp. 2201CG12-4]MEC3908845.1 TlpA disulfide reductase family protein [Tamlana sp. 2201CG12-4]
MVKNEVFFDYTKAFLTPNDGAERSKDFYNSFMANSTNEANKKEATKIYKNLLNMVEGSASPKFVNYENYAGGVSSLDDFKGKYVYIDVWATWCGPCRYEIPFLSKVEKKYHGNKDIEFVSISIDKAKDRDKWRKMVSDQGMGGVQLLADKEYDSEFIKEYGITGIPRFILIDPDGNMIKTEAPRPSDPRLIELFDSLNI